MRCNTHETHHESKEQCRGRGKHSIKKNPTVRACRTLEEVAKWGYGISALQKFKIWLDKILSNPRQLWNLKHTIKMIQHGTEMTTAMDNSNLSNVLTPLEDSAWSKTCCCYKTHKNPNVWLLFSCWIACCLTGITKLTQRWQIFRKKCF